MQVTDEEIRIPKEEVQQMLAALAPLRSSKFIDAVLTKIEEQYPRMAAGELSNYYVNIEIYDY